MRATVTYLILIAGSLFVACGEISEVPTGSGACPAYQPKRNDGRHPDFVRQIATTARMRSVSMLLKEHHQDHGAFPTTMDQLAVYWNDEPPAWECDGWGRPLAFFSWGDRYFLASFGRNGTPESQASQKPRVVLQELDYDTDIVMIDGEWVQSARDVDLE